MVLTYVGAVIVAADAWTGVADEVIAKAPTIGSVATTMLAARDRRRRNVDAASEMGKRRLTRNGGACPLISLPQVVLPVNCRNP
jgi:hypothetical protein